MIRVGFVFGDLDSGGAPAAYFKSLFHYICDSSIVQPTGIYTNKGSSDFTKRGKFIKPSKKSLLPNWHQLESRHDIDIFHINGSPFFGHYPAFRASVPVVATIHSVIHWCSELPDGATVDELRRFRLADRVGRVSLDRICAVSDHVRRILVSKVGYDAKQVVTTYEGVDDSFYSHSRTESPEDVSEPYLLHISTASNINVFRKNMTTIVKTLGLLRRRLNQDLKLVVVGNGWEEQFARSTDLPTNPDGITFSGFVSKERLIQLYDHASCYVFPSLYEGFGIPNVESMARGTPVVTTGKYGTKDIVDDAGMLIEDPLDATELANTIETVLTDEARTANLVDHGRDRAERFRWSKHVACVEDIYTAVS